MRFLQPPPHVAPAGLRALKLLATLDRPLSAASANMLAGAQRALLRTDIPLEDLAPIAPEELAAVLVDPALRRQFVQGMLMLSLADGPPSPAQMTLIESFAAALGVAAPELRTLRLLADEHTIFFRLHFLRRSHLADVARHQIQDQGLLATVKALLGQRGLYEDTALAKRYRALEKLPPESLGFGLATHLNEHGYAFPGEKGGFPEGGVWHDIGHVLTGYGVDPQGELEMASFQAGFKKHNPFFMLLFGALTFSAGINMTPLPQPSTRGLLAEEDLPERVFRAVERGAKVNVDLSDGWDYWPYLERPLAEVRAELHVDPA